MKTQRLDFLLMREWGGLGNEKKTEVDHSEKIQNKKRKIPSGVCSSNGKGGTGTRHKTTKRSLGDTEVILGARLAASKGNSNSCVGRQDFVRPCEQKRPRPAFWERPGGDDSGGGEKDYKKKGTGRKKGRLLCINAIRLGCRSGVKKKGIVLHRPRGSRGLFDCEKKGKDGSNVKV